MKISNSYNSIFQKKFRSISEGIRNDPNNEELYQNLGALYVKYNEYESAEVAYKKAMKLNPENPWTYLYFGNLCYAKNETSKAIEWFTEATRRLPDNSCPFWCLAEAYEKKGQWYLADKYFHQAVDVNPNDSEAVKKLEDWLDRNELTFRPKS